MGGSNFSTGQGDRKTALRSTVVALRLFHIGGNMRTSAVFWDTLQTILRKSFPYLNEFTIELWLSTFLSQPSYRKAFNFFFTCTYLVSSFSRMSSHRPYLLSVLLLVYCKLAIGIQARIARMCRAQRLDFNYIWSEFLASHTFSAR